MDIINIISVIIFILIGIYIYKTQENKKWYILIFYIGQLWAIISCLYIETGIYITEQNRYGYNTGATIRLVLYNSIFFILVMIFLKILGKDRQYENLKNLKILKESRYRNYNIIVNAVYICVFVLIIHLVLSGIPLFSNGEITKFNFWDYYAIFPKLVFIQNNLYFISFILGFIYRESIYVYKFKKNKYKILFCIILIQIYYFLQGNKFTTIVYSLYFYILPIIINNKFKLSKKNKICIFSILTILFIIIMNISIEEYRENGYDKPVEQMVYRVLGLQGHVWWGVDELTINNNTDWYLHMEEEFKNIFRYDEPKTFTGMKYMMILTGGMRGYRFINDGVNFTAGYPAILIVSFGWIGAIIFQIIFAFIVAILIHLLHKNIVRMNLIESTILSKIFFDSYRLSAMGNFSDIFRLETILLLYVLILIYLAKKVVNNRNNINVLKENI